MPRFLRILTNLISPVTSVAAEQVDARYRPSNDERLYGAWSWQGQIPAGAVSITVSFEEDGYYISVRRYSNGALERVMGKYRTTTIGQDHIILEARPLSRLPSSLCPKLGGVLPYGDCIPLELTPAETQDIRIVTPTAIEVAGNKPGLPAIPFSRDPAALLLSAVVSDRLDASLENSSEGNRDYNAGTANNSRRTMASIENWDRGSIRGTACRSTPTPVAPSYCPTAIKLTTSRSAGWSDLHDYNSGLCRLERQRLDPDAASPVK